MDYNLWQQLILGATKPFRTGANILAQNWGSALTGKDMSQQENQGRFLRWLSEGITPEEQQVINDKPYLSALKSSAGMASTLAPFASQGLRTAQLAANPLTNRIAQLASQGALEGSLGGFGLSREGKEVQDTLTGGLAGAGGELFMDYLTNPQFRNMLTDATTTINPQTGARMYKGALEDKQIEGEILKAQNSKIDPLIQEAKKYKTTVNIQDKNDLEYLRRILSEDNIKDIQSGKMVNFRGTPYEDLAKVNLISKTPKTTEQQLAGKIKEVKLKSDTFYHGTSAENARGIMERGFKPGSELPEETFRGGGYGEMQSSISLAETPKDASRFASLTKNGEIVEAKLKTNSKVVSIEGVEDAVELEDYISYLKKQKVDAVYIGGGEKELAVINPKAIIPTKSKLIDIWNKAKKFLK